ncbi:MULTISPECIES: APC family permease [Streptacidiphilus]|uniref:APC family permease n=1 Tax=Streptacidiphilus cavernicola TaxID=3342716 RepID=A0ABV6UKW8_9ACTN|nr:APC family permease [Streptacidiphilus jeojiense]
MTKTSDLSTVRGAALYIGALLGPSVLLLPGLAADLAGPASIIAWIGLLALSALLARVFTALGTLLPRSGGVAAYAEAGLGPRAGRAVGWSFLVGAVCGAPVVCLIGGSYVAAPFGGGRAMSETAAAALLAVVIALTLGGARATTTVQLLLVALLVVMIAVAVIGSAPSAHTSNWTPFAPHGWSSLGSAASVLMLSFVGWEAIAPLVSRLGNPSRQLPRIILSAFAVTAVVYLALAFATVGVLGGRAGSAVPLADLLRVAVGPAGPVIAAATAVVLTLAATNAYLSGAAALAAELRAHRRPAGGRPSRGLQLGIFGTGAVLLGGSASGLVSTAQLVALPTTLFLTVYLGCTAAATRVLTGGTRLAAAVSCVAVAVVMAFAGWSLIGAAVVVGLGASARVRPRATRPAGQASVQVPAPAGAVAEEAGVDHVLD